MAAEASVRDVCEALRARLRISSPLGGPRRPWLRCSEATERRYAGLLRALPGTTMPRRERKLFSDGPLAVQQGSHFTDGPLEADEERSAHDRVANVDLLQLGNRAHRLDVGVVQPVAKG